MAEIDYAFLADFARVEPEGTLTAIGASWTHLTTPVFPSSHRLAVAGRVRASSDEGPIPVTIEIAGPDDTFTIQTGIELESGPDVRPYGEGRVGHLFALNAQIPLPAAGLYVVMVTVPGDTPRRLAFEANSNAESQ